MPLKHTKGKILSVTQLLRQRRSWKRSRRRVVFTNGVFDILHPGHIDLLEKARALGDILILGVNTDASARRLGKKGPRRPIHRLQDRMRVLAALTAVDAVTSFREDTPEKLLSRILPDILVKGADYRADQVAGRQYAGRVALIPLKKGHSTTKILRRIG